MPGLDDYLPDPKKGAAPKSAAKPGPKLTSPAKAPAGGGLDAYLGDAPPAAPAAPAAPASAGKAAPSTVGQLVNMLKSAPSGFAHFGGGLLHEFNPAKRSSSDDLPYWQAMQKDNPVLSQFFESMGRTAGDVRHPTRFAQASRDGRIVSKLVEDAANASIVLGPAAKALGVGADAASAASTAAAGNAARAGIRGDLEEGAQQAARAQRLGKVAQVARAGQTVAQGAEHASSLAASAGDPIYLSTRAASLAKRGLTSDAVAGSALGGRLAEAVASRSERGAARQFLADQAATVDKEKDRQGRVVAATNKLLPTADEQAALFLTRQGESGALAALDRLPEAQRNEVLAETFKDGSAVTPAAFDLARAYEKGVMPAEQAARFREAIRLGDEAQVTPRTTRALLGEGHARAPLSPEQLGDRPLTAVVENATKTLRARADRAGESAARLRSAADVAAAHAQDAAARVNAAVAERGVRQSDARLAALRTAADRTAVTAAEAAVKAQEAADLAVARSVPATPAAARVLGPAPAEFVAQAREARGVAEQARASRLPGSATTTRQAVRAANQLDEAAAQAQTGPTFRGARTRVDRAATLGAREGLVTGKATQAADAAAARARGLSIQARKAQSAVDEFGGKDARPIYGEGKALGAADTRARVLGNLARSAEGRAATAAGRLREATARVESSIEAAPDRWRPALQRAAESRSALTRMADELDAQGAAPAAAVVRSVMDEIPTVIADLKARGVDPTHLIGGVIPEGRLGRGGLSKDRFPTLRKTGAEKQSHTTDVTRTASAQAALEARRFGEGISNVAAVEFRQRFGKTAADLGLGHLTGDELKQAAADAGYKPFDPGPILEGPAKVTDKTVFLRRDLFDEFSRWFDTARPGKVTAALHRVNRAMSTPILRLSPRWQVGNAVSQVMQLTVGAGMTPAQIVKFGAEAIDKLRNHPEEIPARFGHSGQFSDLLATAKAPRTPIGLLAQKSGNLNEWVDRWGKETVYLAKKAKGFNDEAAVRRALQLQIDLRGMSNFERNYVQAVLPYYGWAAHISKLALRLPVEHPTRVAWTLHLADLYGDDESGLPDYLKGGVQLRDGRFLNVGTIVNPFGDVVQSPLLSPSGALGAVSPAIRLGAAAGLGVDVARAQLLKRPPGDGHFDDFGNPSVGPLAPRQAAYVAAQALPQTRLVTGLLGKPVSRYQTGEPLLDRRGQPYATERTRLNTVGRFLGVPTPEKIDANAIVASAEKKQLRAAKSLANYNRKRGAQK